MGLFARQTGEGAQTIVLIHGFAGTHEAWQQIASRLAADHRVLAYDLPGHGRSLAYPGAGPAKVAARAILADLAARDVKTAHLVGHSMGGAVAALAGLFEPDRIASLSLLAPGGFGPEINQRLLARFAGALDERTVRLCLEAMFGWNSAVPEAEISRALEQARDPERRHLLHEIAATLATDGVQGQIPRQMLGTLAMPVQVVWGSLDNVLPVVHASGLPSNFRVRILPGIGHMLPQEAPAELAQMITDFVRDGK